MLGRLLLAAVAFLFVPANASAEIADIERQCSVTFPNVWQYLAWKGCVKSGTQKEAEENSKREKEENARPCIAADLGRMEGLATSARNAVNSTFTLEDVQKALRPIFGYLADIQIPANDIKERVLVYSIQTKCQSPFRFIINVRAGADQKLRSLSTWAVDPPAGYPANLQSQFSVDFDQQREQERWRAEAQRREAEMDAMMAKREKERQELRQSFLRSVKISDVKIKCTDQIACKFPAVEFIMTNISQRPVKNISYGWMLRSPQMPSCPPNMASKERRYKTLQPGETAVETFIVSDNSAGKDAKLCISVTDLDAVEIWER